MTTMGATSELVKILLGSALLATICDLRVESTVLPSYWKQRHDVLQREENIAMGGDLHLDENERIVNDILMEAKHKEFDEGLLHPEKFLPSQNFLEAKDAIERSEVFKILRELPKGGVLHVHDSAMLSADFIYRNVTFRENLYVCDRGSKLVLRFLAKPTTDEKCQWKLLSEQREDPAVAERLNARIRSQLTMAVENPQLAYPTGDDAWRKFLSIFDFLKSLMTYRPVYEDRVYMSLQEHYDDNVQYVEMKSSLSSLYELDGRVYSRAEVARITKEVVERFKADHPDFIGAKIIYAKQRDTTVEGLQEYLKMAKGLIAEHPSFVAGFDLVGQEDRGQTLATFADELRKVVPDMKFFFHAGETDWYGTDIDKNLVDAVLLNAKRIGHGYAVTKHPVILGLIKRRNIAVELNPISNQVLGLVKDLRNHPGSVLFSQDYPVVVSNDDPGLWEAKGLSYDFYEAFMGLMSRDADLRALKRLAANSLIYSSMDEDEKKRAFRLWKTRWSQFVEKLLSAMKSRRASDADSFYDSLFFARLNLTLPV